jgi:adenylylsulfate kinase-like enzyme
MKKSKKNNGILFWITGLSGAGKTVLAKSIQKNISKKYGPTICVSGDQVRKIFNLKGYSKNERLKIGKKYINFINLILKQKINVIFAVVGLFHELHTLNRKLFPNYVEIYIKSDFNILKSKRKKIFYRKKIANVWGQDIKAQFPKKPDIVIRNNFNKDIDKLSSELINKIDKKILI